MNDIDYVFLKIDQLSPEEVKAWLGDRLANCKRLASHKSGADRDGWLDDAAFFSAAIGLIDVKPKDLPHAHSLDATLAERAEIKVTEKMVRAGGFALAARRGVKIIDEADQQQFEADAGSVLTAAFAAREKDGRGE